MFEYLFEVEVNIWLWSWSLDLAILWTIYLIYSSRDGLQDSYGPSGQEHLFVNKKGSGFQAQENSF